MYLWDQQKSITVTPTSASFFKDLVPSVSTGTYSANSAAYTTLYEAVREYADGYFNIVATYAQSNGSLSEQFDRSNGSPLSAYDLTWSYAAFLTAAARRAGVVPSPWGAGTKNTLPSVCRATSVPGTYSSATLTRFPSNQTPQPNATATPTSSGTATSTTSCTATTSVSVTFNELVATSYGDTIKIVGNIDILGNWDAVKAVSLNADAYTSDNPIWTATVILPAGRAVEYKYINAKADGSLQWEADPNHSYTVPSGCTAEATRSDKWQS